MPRKSRKFLVGILLLVGILALVAVFFLRSFPLSSLIAAIRSVKAGYLLPGFGLMALFVFFEAAASNRILSALGSPIPVRRCLTYSMLGFCCASITPSSSGGQPAQIYAMRRDGVPISLASLNMLLLAISYQCSMLACGLLSYAVLGTLPGTGGAARLLLFGALINAVLTVGMLCLLFCPGGVRRAARGIISLLQRLHILKPAAAEKALSAAEGGIDRYAEGAACVRRSPKLLLQVFCLTTLQFLSAALVPCVVCLAFGITSQLPQAAATQAVLNLSVAAFPLPGAVGAAEGGFLNLFRPIFGAELVAPALVLCRGISFYLFLPLCALGALLTFRRTKAKIPA